MQNLFRFLLILLLATSCESSITIIPGSDSGSRSRSNNNGDLPSVTVNNFEKEIFLLVNNHRKKINRKQLKWHDNAVIESQDHSQDMASFRTPFGHSSYTARIARIESKDNDTILKSGENVAQNSTAKRAFEAWLRSPGHRRNIEGDFTHHGVGAVKSANGSWYFTQIFLKK